MISDREPARDRKGLADGVFSRYFRHRTAPPVISGLPGGLCPWIAVLWFNQFTRTAVPHTIHMRTRSFQLFPSAFFAVLFAAPAKAEDGLFSFVFETAPAARAGNNSVTVEAPIEKLGAPLEVASVSLYRVEQDGLYRLSLEPGKEIDFITPVLIDGDRAALGRMKQGGPGPVGQVLWFHFKEIEDARLWLQFVTKHFKIEAADIEDSTEAAD